MLARSSLESSQTLCRGRALSRARAAGAAIGLLALVSFMQSPKAAEPARDYSAVTDARLVSPEAANWLMYRRNYDAWGYSPLDQINARNVQRARAGVDAVDRHDRRPPVAADRERRHDVRHDAVQPGARVRRQDRRAALALSSRMPPDIRMGHPTNRGVALYGDKVYIADVRRERRRARRQDRQASCGTRPSRTTTSGYYMTLAPLAAQAARSWSASRAASSASAASSPRSTPRPAARSGRPTRFPAPGEPGHDTLAAATRGRRAARRSGSPAAYDPAAQPHVLGHRQRRARGPATSAPATTSTRARCSRSTSTPASCAGYHQYHWNDSWDWDEVSAPLLIDVQRDGRTVKGLVHPGRNGYLWLLERARRRHRVRRRASRT